ncbi:hypothetical protein RF240_03515 [Dickeya dadantii]|uniref:hypothetical protein n=1 Tax=Dickeya dadantii TaxID=204038 RepID=UPI0035A8A9F4
MTKSIRELTIKSVIHLFFSRRSLWLLAANAFTISLGFYFFWSGDIASHIILVEGLPKQGIALTVAAIAGISITLAVSIFHSSKGMPEKFKQWSFCFLLSAGFGYASAINAFEIYVYLHPEKVIDYVTDYKISFPGPSNGKHRCEAGIWIKEQHTGRWLELCSSKEQLKLGENRRQGMDGMYVVAQVNRYGSYIQHYEFAFK